MTPPTTETGIVELKAWPFFGYAPGNYMARCDNCGETKSDLDKRAISCLECAVKRSKAYTAELQSSAAMPDSTQLLQTMAGALVALADGADKCAEAPHFIVQPFLSIYREHGETIAQARTLAQFRAQEQRS